jgi:LmbE family N-acetylglucosaminyl deacetylase
MKTSPATAVALLAGGEPIDLPTVIVVAHPDDDVLSMGGRLLAFRHLTVIQLTNGAPASGDDARRLGFASNAAYAAAREQEAREAYARLGLSCRRIRLDAPDQDCISFVTCLADVIAEAMRGAELVFTHPYEGGHPDHDAAALTVQRACAALKARADVAPARLEFASYHLGGNGMITGAFFPSPQSSETCITLTPDQRNLKRHALAAYKSQAAVLRWFDPGVERYRTAPDYDFSQAAPPGRALYDGFGWAMTAATWRRIARPLLPY